MSLRNSLNYGTFCLMWNYSQVLTILLSYLVTQVDSTRQSQLIEVLSGIGYQAGSWSSLSLPSLWQRHCRWDYKSSFGGLCFCTRFFVWCAAESWPTKPLIPAWRNILWGLKGQGQQGCWRIVKKRPKPHHHFKSLDDGHWPKKLLCSMEFHQI